MLQQAAAPAAIAGRQPRQPPQQQLFGLLEVAACPLQQRGNGAGGAKRGLPTEATPLTEKLRRRFKHIVSEQTAGGQAGGVGEDSSIAPVIFSGKKLTPLTPGRRALAAAAAAGGGRRLAR